jgi:hypothetical protein
VESAGGLLGPSAQLGSELDDDAAARPDVVEGASRNVDALHFFERHRLRAELNAVGLERTTPAALRLDGEKTKQTLLAPDLDAIGFAYEAELAAPEPNTPCHIRIVTSATARNIRRRMS